MRASRSWPRARLFVAALVTAALVAPALARPRKGTLLVQLDNAPGTPAKTARAVHLVDASTGALVLARPIGGSRQAALRPPAGAYVAVGSLARPGGSRAGASRVFHFDPAARLTLKIGLRKTAPTAESGLARTASHGVRAAARGAPVGTMGSVALSAGGSTTSIAGPLFTPLFNATSDVITWVETGRAFLDQRARELALQNEGRTDPSTTITDALIPPDFRVDGRLESDGNRVTGEIVITDPRTGEAIDRIPVDVPIDEWSDFLNDLAREIARRLRSRATTTTTSSTTSTSTSSSTNPTATSTTRPRVTTTTTVPPGGTCTSVIPASFCECMPGGGSCTRDADCFLGTCVDHVGHTLVTYQFAGPGGRFGAIRIDGTESGLFSVPTGVGVLGGCGTPAFTQGVVDELPPERRSCSAYYHPGAMLEIHAGQSIHGVDRDAMADCYADFAGWAGNVDCAGGLGTCDGRTCSCTTTTGTSPMTVIVNYTVRGGPGCAEP